jgi:hypothetical protein
MHRVSVPDYRPFHGIGTRYRTGKIIDQIYRYYYYYLWRLGTGGP